MKFEDVFAKVGHVPYITKDNGRFLYDLIIKEKLTSILELGFAHGTATCYMAAALQELDGGSITAVDLIDAKELFQPSVEEQLETTGLTQFVKIERMQTGYTWFLHDEIARNSKDNVCNEVYDLCIIDGPKNWTIDGAAFFLADKLLKKNAFLIFDDYLWTYAHADKSRDVTDGISHRSLSKEEIVIPQIREVFELLVKQHPHYGNLMVFEGAEWAIAQKTMSQDKSYTIIHRETMKSLLATGFYKLYKKVFKFK